MNRLPSWFLQEIPAQDTVNRSEAPGAAGVHTVCREAQCPNTARCLKDKQVTFLILGDTCTRHCLFCAVKKAHAALAMPDAGEPQRVAAFVKGWNLRYAVVTSVTRDDLVDAGAGQFVSVIRAIRDSSAGTKIEVLVPDFQGMFDSVATVVHAGPHVFGHNLETVRRLYPQVRPEADYHRSLAVLKAAKTFNPAIVTKSSIMLGLGENEYDVYASMQHLRAAGVDILTLGQYLAPSAAHYPVQEFITPQQFAQYGDIAKQFGFRAVLSGPLVRSSFCASELYHSLQC